MIKEAIEKIVMKEDLTYEEAYTVMNEIMSGETSQTQNAAFLAALSTKSTKKETEDEILGCAKAMRENAIKCDLSDMDTMDIVGTGGDKAGSFNISTTTSFVVASGDIKVAKHGNRAASSLSGTADCLEALGANIDKGPKECRKLLEDTNFCFFFAQKYHTSMKYVGAIRKELGIRTVFNILGPLTNPGCPNRQLLGVYDECLVEPLARVISQMGVKRGLVVYGKERLDEISAVGETLICEVNNGYYKTYSLTPEMFGLDRCTKDDLRGGSAEDNAKMTRGILTGDITDGRLSTVLMNAAAALYIGDKAASIEEGIDLAKELITSGKAIETLDKYVEASNK